MERIERFSLGLQKEFSGLFEVLVNERGTYILFARNSGGDFR